MAWGLAATLAVLIICSRKHYTVDVLIAWYVVPLVFLALERRYTTRERNDADALKSVELQSILVADEERSERQEPAEGLLLPAELEAHAGSTSGTVYEGARLILPDGTFVVCAADRQASTCASGGIPGAPARHLHSGLPRCPVSCACRALAEGSRCLPTWQACTGAASSLRCSGCL